MAFTPILCYVTDRKLLASPGTDTLLTVIRRAVAAGVDMIQIREKDLSGRALVALAREAIASSAGSSTRILINDRLDVAIAARAAGVHLGSASLPVADVASWCTQHVPGYAAPALRRASGAKHMPAPQSGAAATSFLLGASCHSLADAQAAERDAAHYVIFGPVFPTPSKLQYGPPQGLARLEEVCREVRIPVLAIGGVTLENAADCLRAGAAGIAAIRLFQDASDIASLVSSLRAT